MLDDIEEIIGRSKEIYERYYESLSPFVSFQKRNQNANNNFNYVPVIFKDAKTRQKIEVALLVRSVLARRYFSPSLDTLDYLDTQQYMPISRDISERILCLPIYPSLSLNRQLQIIKTIQHSSYTNS